MQSTLKIMPELMNFVRPSPHSTYSPSAIDRWIACPFSVKASEGIEIPAGPWAEEGTLAHSVCEAVFFERFLELPFDSGLSFRMSLYEKSNPGSTADMLMYANSYVDVIEYWLKDQEKIGDVIWYGLEKGIPVFPELGAFGTGDCIIVGSKGCAVIDFKYGKGKNVAAGSLQLKMYAAGIARYLLNVPENYGYYSIVFQPRIDQYPKEASYTHQELLAFLGSIKEAIEESKKQGLEPIEGSHCHWCPARQTKDLNRKCPAIAQRPIKAAEQNFAQYLADMSAPIEKVGAPNLKRDLAMMKVMAMAPLIAQIAKDAEEEFSLRIQSGEVIPNLTIVEELGNREVNGNNDEEKAALIRQHFPQVQPLVTKTVTKLRTLGDIEEEIGKNKLSPLCTRKIKKTLKIIDDRLKTVLGDMAVYGNLTNHSGGIE